MSLALLIKPNAIFYSLPFIYLTLKKYGISGLLKNKHLLIAIDIMLIPVLLWRYWIGNPPYLVGIPHLKWAFNGDGIRFRPAFWFWIFGERLGNMILGIWGLIIFYLGVANQKVNNKVIYPLLFGMFLYVSIIATANVRHDYYQVFIIPVVALVLSSGLHHLLIESKFSYIRFASTGFILGMMFLIGWYRIRGFYQINHYEYIEAGQRVDELLPKDALVIAPANGDSTFLYHTNRKGWPVVNTDITSMIKKGADYFVATNFADPDVKMFKELFEVVEETDRYIIIDLTKPL